MKKNKNKYAKYSNTIIDDEKLPGVDINSAQRRLPSIILIDSSASMSKYSDIVKKSIISIYNEILDNPVASRAVELGIITFNETTKIQQPICEIYRQKRKGHNLQFECEGQTLTGFAVNEALNQLELRKKEHINAKSGVRSYAPLLFIISDGAPFCAVPEVQRENMKLLDEACKEIKEKVSSDSLRVVCFEIGERCSHDIMQKLTGTDDSRRVIHISGESDSISEISEVFSITSSMIVSQSNGEDFNENIGSIKK